jgi:hypothetical protein
MFPPCKRIIGFILVLCSFLANIPVIIHAIYKFTNVYILILLIAGLIFFGLMTFYTWKFFFVEHYTNPEKTHIAGHYIRKIQDNLYEWIRFTSFCIYTFILLCTMGFSTYLPDAYKQLSNWQKTMFAYNYAVASFTVMYFYEHKYMNKYLSLPNVTIYEDNDRPFMTEDERLVHYDGDA